MKFVLGLVDFLVILFFYIIIMFEEDGMLLMLFFVLRIICFVCVLWVLKFLCYSKGLKVFVNMFLISGKDFFLLFVVLIINVILFLSVIYYVENDIKDNDFESILDVFWWMIVIMIVVGYGDKVLKGVLGKLIGVVCVVLGIVVLFCFFIFVFFLYFEEMYKLKGSGLGKKVKEKENE